MFISDVVEYNHRFGRDLAVTIPDDEGCRRGRLRPITYFGASLKALCLLGKGYAFVGCNSNGVNAFFLRRDRLTPALRELLRLPLVGVMGAGEEGAGR